MQLLDAGTQFGLTKLQAASLLGIPVKTYIRYEKDEHYGDSLKRSMMIRSLVERCEITETKGLLTIDQIKVALTKVFEEKYKGQIDFCYIFGSYAKG